MSNQATSSPENFNYRRELQDYDPFYVLNGSAGRGRESGIIHFNIKDGDDLKSVVVQNTTIPQDLTQQALMSQLKNSMELQRLISMRALIVLTPKDGDTILATPEAKNEAARMRDVQARGLAGMNVTPDGKPVVASDSPFSGKATGAYDVRSDAPGDPINMNVGVEIIDRHSRGEITDQQAAAAIASLGPTLTSDEKLRLRQMQDLPRALREAVATLN